MELMHMLARPLPGKASSSSQPPAGPAGFLPLLVRKSFTRPSSLIVTSCGSIRHQALPINPYLSGDEDLFVARPLAWQWQLYHLEPPCVLTSRSYLLMRQAAGDVACNTPSPRRGEAVGVSLGTGLSAPMHFTQLHLSYTLDVQRLASDGLADFIAHMMLL